MSELDQAAVDFLSQQDAPEESGIVDAPADSDSKPNEASKVNPAEPKKTPEQTLAEAEGAKQEAARLKQEALDKLAKINSQFGAHERKRKALDQREAQVIEREKSIAELNSVQSITAHIAKVRGIGVDDVWQEWADEIKNGGKPSEATVLKREREALEREKKDREQSAAQQEQERRAMAEKQWGDEMDGIIGAETFKAEYPRLSALPGQLLIDTLVQRTREYQSQTGNLPEQTSLLKWLESQFPEAPKPVQPTQPKARLPNSKDASVIPRDRPLTEAERDAAAVQYLAGLPEE